MIYTTGTIAISGNTATGVGTNFTAPLSLIRVGCTLIAVGNPVQIFSITEIKSGTQLSVYPAANPAIPAGTEFSILLTDSISVDGLAQDVAETLRYYQGQETEIATAVEWWKEFGGDGQMDQLLSNIREETAVSTANAQKTEADKNAAAASKTAAANSATAAKASQDAAKDSETAAKASQTAAKTSQDAAKVSETNAKSSETAANNSKNAAATSATSAATSATNAENSATKAATSERNAKTSETNAGNSASSASTSATAAANSAGAAKTSQDAAKSSENAANTSKNAAKTSETNAAQSAADALNYRNQAQAIVGTDIGLGADRRDWPDCNDPTAYIGFCRAEAASAKNFPSIASGELYLVGWLARGDGAIINGCFVGTVTRSLYTYKYNNADKSVAWTRHARRDDVSRFVQNDSTTRMYGPTGDRFLEIHANGNWGVYSTADGAWIPLDLSHGGTGGRNAGQARTNLQVMYEQKSDLAETDLNSLTGEFSGFYRQKLNAQATTNRHYPCNYAGALVVMGSGANGESACTQIYYPYNYSASYYVRTFDAASRTWSDWVNYLSSWQTLCVAGLGSSVRDCADISGSPADWTGFIRIQRSATGFPAVASGETYLTGFIQKIDGSPAFSGIFQGISTYSLYTYRHDPVNGAVWKRHARIDEVDRLSQWGSETWVYNADRSMRLGLTASTWGCYSDTQKKWIPLDLSHGGTGALDAATARTNLGLGTGNDPQFQNLKLTRKSDGTTGWVAGGLLKTQLYSTTDTLRVEGLVYAETGLASPSQLTLSIYTPSEGQKYFSFNTKGQILAETAIFRSAYTNPLIIQSATPTINFNETDRPSGAPYYNFIFDGGNWRIQKEGDGHNGEYIISYEYANDRIVIPNLKVEELYAPADKVQQIKNNLLIPNTGLSRWYDYAAPAGAEANKFYPVVISHPAGWNGDAFVEVSMRTRSLSGSQEPNCNAIHLWMRDAGWSDMGQACFGHYHAYDSSEVAILCVRGTDKGQYPHNVVYVRGDAFPIRLAATVGSTITIPTSDWKPATSADSPTYLWGISNANEGLSIDTYGIGANLLNFSGGRSGFYSDKTFRDPNGGEYLARTCSVGTVDITATDKFNWRGVSNFYGTVNGGAGFFATSDNVSGCSFISKLLNGSGATIGQTELRAGENQGQIVVRDLTSAQAHRFFNFNKDGTFSAPSGIVTHTGVDLNGQQSDNVNKFKPIAGQVNAPENNVVYGGFHVGFSGNYGAQLVMRNDKAYFRTIEKGTEGTWKRLASMESGRLKVIGSATNRESMDCNIVGYDANGQNMSWFLGQYGNVQYRTYFEDYLGGAGVMLNGDDGSVQLYSGGLTTGTHKTLTVKDDGVYCTTNARFIGSNGKFLQLQNDGNSSLDQIILAWGSTNRPTVMEFKTTSEYLFYAQKNTDGSRNMQVNGSINCTTLNQSSDRELKENIEVISGATEALRKMNGYTYTLKDDGMPYAGVIAQEVQEALPEAVGSFNYYGDELCGPTQDGHELREETRYLNVDYAAVTGLLVQVGRETDMRVSSLEAENEALKANIAVMDERISRLEALLKQLTEK
ncbi:pyocin knob domain-containing S74 family peptidase [Escherichia coli]